MNVLELILWFPVVLFSLSLHECAHAIVAKWGGDDGPEREGRITLNPASHIDPIGTIILPVALALSGAPVFGWAKPVMTRPAAMKKPIWNVWVALAGPASNLMLAIAVTLAVKVAILIGGSSTAYEFLRALASHSRANVLMAFAATFIQLNVLLTVLNLLPLPSLDGGWVLYHFLIRHRPQLEQLWHGLQSVGFVVLYALLTVPGFRQVFIAAYQVPMGAILYFLTGR